MIRKLFLTSLLGVLVVGQPTCSLSALGTKEYVAIGIAATAVGAFFLMFKKSDGQQLVPFFKPKSTITLLGKKEWNDFSKVKDGVVRHMAQSNYSNGDVVTEVVGLCCKIKACKTEKNKELFDIKTYEEKEMYRENSQKNQNLISDKPESFFGKTPSEARQTKAGFESYKIRKEGIIKIIASSYEEYPWLHDVNVPEHADAYLKGIVPEKVLSIQDGTEK